MAKYLYSGFSVAQEETTAKKIKTKGIDFNAILANKEKLLNVVVPEKVVEEKAPVVEEHKYSFEEEAPKKEETVEQHTSYQNTVPSIANPKLPEEIFKEKLEKCEEGTVTHVILENAISQIEHINDARTALVSKKEDGLAELKSLHDNLVEEETKLKEQQALELKKLADRQNALEEQTSLYSRGMDEKIKALDTEKANIVENTNAELPKAQEADELTKRVGEFHDRQQKILGSINPELLKGLDNEPEEPKKPSSIFHSFRVVEEEGYKRAI